MDVIFKLRQRLETANYDDWRDKSPIGIRQLQTKKNVARRRASTPAIRALARISSWDLFRRRPQRGRRPAGFFPGSRAALWWMAGTGFERKELLRSEERRVGKEC